MICGQTSIDSPKTTINDIEITDSTAFDSGSYSNGTLTYGTSSNIGPFESSEIEYKPGIFSIGLAFRFWKINPSHETNLPPDDQLVKAVLWWFLLRINSPQYLS